ncbi:hypothetical protein ACH4YO_28005 [Streptomyces noursei]
MAKNLKPGDRIDTEVIFVDTKVPLVPTPEADATKHTSSAVTA